MKFTFARKHPGTALAAAAARYCAWWERMPERDSGATDKAFATQEARTMRALLAEVYSHALELDQQQINLKGIEKWPEPRRWTQADLPDATARLGALPFSYYRNVVDGHRMELESTPPIGDLCNDALDVWAELRGTLDLWHEGQHDAAAWHWIVTFEVELGYHAIHAMQALHDFLTDDGP